jgi:hypothetical protein
VILPDFEAEFMALAKAADERHRQATEALESFKRSYPERSRAFQEKLTGLLQPIPGYQTTVEDHHKYPYDTNSDPWAIIMQVIYNPIGPRNSWEDGRTDKGGIFWCCESRGTFYSFNYFGDPLLGVAGVYDLEVLLARVVARIQARTTELATDLRATPNTVRYYKKLRVLELMLTPPPSPPTTTPDP